MVVRPQGSKPSTANAASSTTAFDAVGVADRERLGEVRPVRVAVDAHHGDAELVEHGGEVVGGRAGAVRVGGRPEALRAAADLTRVVALAGLQSRAVDRAGGAGPAVVHEDQVVRPAQRPEQELVAGPGLDRAVAGAAFGRDDRRAGRARGVAARDHPEPHGDARAGRVGAVQRDAHRAAARPLVASRTSAAPRHGPRPAPPGPRRAGRGANRMRKRSATLPATAGASKTRIRPVEPRRVRMRLS